MIVNDIAVDILIKATLLQRSCEYTFKELTGCINAHFAANQCTKPFYHCKSWLSLTVQSCMDCGGTANYSSKN